MDLQEKFNILLTKFNLGKFDEVIFEATLMSKKYPAQEVFINLLSLSYQAKGEFNKSILILEEALKKGKKNFNFWNNLGLGYLKIKNFNKSEECLIEANKLNPKFINTLNNLGNLYVELNNFDKAELFFKKALEINDKIIETNYNLATLLQSVGRIEDAKHFYNKTLDINENFTRADFGLAMLEKYDSSNNHIKIMESKTNKELHKSSYKDLYFALGKVYEDIGDFDKSFLYIKKGNDIKKEITNYQIEKDKKLFEEIISFQEKNELNNNSKENMKNVIFILGMPRTGTSMVEQIISNHSEVEGGGEISLLSFYLDKFFNNKNKNLDINEHLNLIKKEYLDYLNKITKSKIITDKAPLNFRWIGIIKYLFPNCKIIHCKRDPLESSWSIFKNEFERGMFFSNTFEDIAEFYHLYKNLMDYWKKKFDDNIFDLNYEDLINDPENKIKEIINYCGLDWQNNCLEFYKNKKSIKTVSFMQARKPIYKDSLKGSSKFKKHLNQLEKLLKT